MTDSLTINTRFKCSMDLIHEMGTKFWTCLPGMWNPMACVWSIMSRNIWPTSNWARSITLMRFYFSCMLWEIDVCISLPWVPHGPSYSPGNKQEPEKRDQETASLRQMSSSPKLSSAFSLFPLQNWLASSCTIETQMIIPSVFIARPPAAVYLSAAHA